MQIDSEASISEVIDLKPIIYTSFDVLIAGTSDLIIDKMDDETTRNLLDKQAGRPPNKEHDEWRCITTSLHWFDEIPKVHSEQELKEAFKTHTVCVSSFGVKKQLALAVVRFKYDKYSTGFNSNVNLRARKHLIPINFKEHFLDEKLIKTKLGSPVRCVQNRFSDWSATLSFEITGKDWTPEKVINVVNECGFGLGIGSGTQCDYGRFVVADVCNPKSFGRRHV